MVNGKAVSHIRNYTGILSDPWGNVKAGFSINGKINRKDFGLNWNAALEAGGVLVGEEVKISGDLELVKVALVSCPEIGLQKK